MARARRGFRTLEIALLAILLSVPWTVEVEAGGRGLRLLLKSLDLTSDGASRWLLALGVDRSDTRQERLIAMTTSREFVGQIVGSDFAVTIAPELMARLDEPGADIVLIHNHPSSTSLSWADISFLTKPGVAAVVAIGHDGSVYAAMRGRRFACERVSRLIYQQAAEAARRTFEQKNQVPALVGEGLGLPQHLSHIMADTLGALRVIDYHAVMTRQRSAAYQIHRHLLEGPLSAQVAAILSRPVS